VSYESWRISYQSSEQAARAAFDEIATLRAQLAAAEARGLAAVRWRDVADELPQEAQEVLFVRGGKTVHGAWIGGIFWHNNQKMAAAKWMPLPAPQTDAALRKEVKPAESTNQQQGETK
jgi:hypothetical protein